MLIFNLLLYFILITSLLYVYLIITIFLVKSIVYIIRESKLYYQQKNATTDEDRKAFILKDYLLIVKTNPFLLHSTETKTLLIAVLAGNIILWQYFRSEWVYNGYKHKTAMEYHSLSHLLLTYEMGMLTLIQNPNAFILKPLNALQDSLISEAKTHLPKEDGEAAMFDYFFKLYPYAKLGYDPHHTEAKEISTLTYTILKDLSTKDIEDTKVREYRRYQLFPIAAEYFIFIQWNEYPIANSSWDEAQKSGIALFNDKVKLQQLEDIGRWALRYYTEYKKYPKIKNFMERNPKIEVMYINEIVAPLREVMESKVFHLTFRCEDELLPIIYKYVELYKQKFEPLMDKYYDKYDNVVVSKSTYMSDAACALCDVEPIKGTYVFDDKKDACYPTDRYKYLTTEYRESDPSTHYKWIYRVNELEKIIKNTNVREGYIN